MFSFHACIYTTFLNNFVAVTFRKEYKKDIRQNPRTLLMLHKWGLHIPDAAKKASMQMYSPLSCALLWKVLLQVQSCISDFLHWKLRTYLKEMSFLCWVLSPRIMQIYTFLTLLLCVDCNGSYFWGVGMEENCNFVTVKYSVALHLVEPVHGWK